MKNIKHHRSKTTKFVRIDNATWIEADIWIPDDVARVQFLQKVQLTKPLQYSVQSGNDSLVIKS